MSPSSSHDPARLAPPEAGAPEVAVAPAGLRHVGRYSRHMPVSLERMFENALDWEHLPWLHATSFASIQKTGGGADFWQAEAEIRSPGSDALQPVALELRLETARRRWITRTTMPGAAPPSEVWTVAVPDPDETGLRVFVDFYVPGLAQASEEDAAKVGFAFSQLYERLYDEDEAMMRERQRELDARSSPNREAGEAPASREAALQLGPPSALRARLPLEVQAFGVRWRVIEVAGELRVHAARCPHWLGPLDAPPASDGSLACPWHGYRFDLETGSELAGRRCRLPTAPKLVADASGELQLIAPGRPT